MTEERPGLILTGPPLEDEPGLGSLTLPGYIRELATRYAEREAVAYPDPAGQVLRWTYADLLDHARAVAQALIAGGLQPGEIVGVMITNRPEWLASVFGVSLAGGVAAPLSTFSTPAELEYLLIASKASVLIFESQVLKKDFAEILRVLEPLLAVTSPATLTSAKFPNLKRLVCVGGKAGGALEEWDTFLAQGAAASQGEIDARSDSVAPGDPGLIYFSSGSTGRPKGIINAHRGVTVQCWRWSRLMGFTDRLGIRGWSANGFFWSGAFAQALGATFSSGGCLILQPTFDAARALALIEAEQINYLVCVPHQYAQFCEAANWTSVDLGSLRYISRGTCLETHPTVDVVWKEPTSAYGCTEAFTLVTNLPVGTPTESWEGNHGPPLPGASLKIIDPFSGDLVPRGTRGEIAIKGATLMIGYVGVSPAETFDDDGFFRTGDGGYIDPGGRLVWEGRLNDIIKTGGANVSPVEIDMILRDLPGVRIANTVGVPDPLLGEMVVSCIVRSSGCSLTENDVQDALKQVLASYKVPRRVLFFEEQDVATTGSAKVKTNHLRTLATRRLAQPSQG